MLLNLNPLVYYEDKFLTPFLCEHLIDLARERLQPSKVLGDDGKPVEHEARSSEHAFIPHHETKFTQEIVAKVSIKMGIHPNQAEQLQVIRYEAGQQYKAHYDSFEGDNLERALENGGQRIATALIYLNNPISGGGTNFPVLKRRVDAVQGRVVFFTNTYLGNTIRHPYSQHGGEPVGRGEKWACNLWYREKEYKRGEANGNKSTENSR